MQIFSEINIEHISVIVKKNENADFVYRCFGRFKDGFVLVTNGKGVFENAELKIPLQKNSLLILNKGEQYRISALDNNFEYITTAFNTVPIKSLDLIGLPTFMELNQYPYLIYKFEQLLKTWEERSPLYISKTKILLEQILIDLFDINSKTIEYATDENRLLPAIDYINRFYDKEISAEQLATLCKLSVSHFRRIFKEKYGISPLKYREQVRIHWAKQLLKSDFFTISEIAEKLGYYDIYHFSKDFKKYTGISPKQYLKSISIT